MMSLAMIYAGAALAPKILTSGTDRCVPGFDLQILMDQEQKIQLLAFILVKSFGLDRKHGICIKLYALFLKKPCGKSLFVLFLDLGELLKYVLVICICQEFLQF